MFVFFFFFNCVDGGYTVYIMICLTRRMRIFGAVLLLSLFFLVFLPHSAFALDPGKLLGELFNTLLGGLMSGLELILQLFQFLFLEVIKFTILDFATQWDDGVLSGFRTVWQILRDFVNLAIVIIFIVTAMMTSLGDGRFGFHRKSLIYLIFAAVFVNFSAFLTLLIIDISHIAFMLFFNAIDTTSWGSISPFAGYSKVLGEVASPMFNFIVALIAIVVTWFIILGILRICIILIERYIIAMFLVLLSPLAVLGFFAGLSGGNRLVSKFADFHKSWSERLGYAFVTPVVLILGFTLLLVLFRDALGPAVDADNFVKLLGIRNPEGRAILLRLIIASIVFIFGIFQVGKMAEKAGLHPAVAKKFNFGKFMKNRADNFSKGKTLRGFAMNTVGKIPLGNREDSDRKIKNVNDWLKSGPTQKTIPRRFAKSITRGLSGQGKKFSDPEHLLGSPARKIGAFLKTTDSGKVYKDPGSTFKEFGMLYKRFSGEKVGDKEGVTDKEVNLWDDSKKRDYYRLRDRLTDLMEDDERRKSLASGNRDAFLKSQIRQMNEFWGGDESKTSDDSDVNLGGGSTGTSSAESGDSGTSGSGDSTEGGPDSDSSADPDIPPKKGGSGGPKSGGTSSGSGAGPEAKWNTDEVDISDIPDAEEHLKNMSDSFSDLHRSLKESWKDREKDATKEFTDSFSDMEENLKKIWEDQKTDFRKKILEFEEAYENTTKTRTQQEADKIESGIAKLKQQEEEIQSQRELANKTDDDLQDIAQNKDRPDSEKNDVFKSSVGFTEEFIQESRDHLAKKMEVINKDVEQIEKSVKDKNKLDQNTEYKKLQRRKKKTENRQKRVSDLVSSIDKIVNSSKSNT